ncbi:MAG: ATP synthase F1 subunit epsilon [Patescibacteria group bacterium]
MTISLKVVTPERIVFEDEVDSITTMTQMGEITILSNHVPIVATLRSGETTLRKGGEEYYLATSTGFLEVRSGNEVVILADTAERSEELDLEAIEKAKERAHKMLEEKQHVDDVSFAEAAAMLERELARFKVASKRKYRNIPNQPIK